MNKFLNIEAIQDGLEIEDRSVIERYALSGRDVQDKYDRETGRTYPVAKFVGIVAGLSGTDLLISLPKNYMNLEDFRKLDYHEKIRHVRLIMANVCRKFDSQWYTRFDRHEDTEGNFAMDAFYRIYDYYRRYDLYKVNKRTIKPGYYGKVAWKDTMNRASKVIDHGNLVLLPMYIKEKQQVENLITESMIFAINYTELLFGQFIDLPDNSKIAGRGIDARFLNNTKEILNFLYQFRNTIYKDIDKELLNDIIVFLEKLNAGSRDKQHAVKDYSFSSVWEKAVEKYLNDYFVGMKDGKLEYSEGKNAGKKRFGKQVNRGYNRARPEWSMQPDHYYKDGNTLYIFDSKYYNDVTDLNHKQFVYHVLYGRKVKVTYDALIIPSSGKTDTELYVDIPYYWDCSDESGSDDDGGIVIYLNRLNTIDVLKNFIG